GVAGRQDREALRRQERVQIRSRDPGRVEDNCRGRVGDAGQLYVDAVVEGDVVEIAVDQAAEGGACGRVLDKFAREELVGGEVDGPVRADLVRAEARRRRPVQAVNDIHVDACRRLTDAAVGSLQVEDVRANQRRGVGVAVGATGSREDAAVR